MNVLICGGCVELEKRVKQVEGALDLLIHGVPAQKHGAPDDEWQALTDKAAVLGARVEFR